ncbi:hypothetical protein BDV23DRAFT_8836 [Aspergillus alliaceus]|uniref:Zn(2)-C6 fungal-type domain-containing protein n=1 Tax=Petromyces alliaceus TaxID=209559 RepID=A0A5N7BW75_PETAA|nr:hypothetical protein BDV23DRAFT_8836 [Aspergillus alliaceus]
MQGGIVLYIVLIHTLSFNMESPRETTPKKRLACDRCHARKLRCSRDPTGCLRCIRDGSTCIYSPALKVGRPSKASMAAKDVQSGPSRTIADAALFTLPGTESVSTDSGISLCTPQSHMRGELIPGSSSFFFDCLDLTNHSSAGDDNQEFSSITNHDEVWTTFASPTLNPHEAILDPRLGCTSPTKEPSNVTNAIERLSHLQQELLRTRMAAPQSGDTSIGRKSVEAALKPGQETLDVVRDLLHQAPRDNGRNSNLACSDWQTALHLVLTPLSLLLSTYNEIVREIRTAVIFTTQGSLSGSPYSGLFDAMDLRLGDLRLDRQLRLILLATVIEYQLNQLHHTLRLFQNKHMQSEMSMAEGMQSSAMTELQSTIRTLLSLIRKILQQSPEI